MSKCLNEIKIEEIIKNCFNKKFAENVEKDARFEPEYEKYGSTWVKSGEYLDEEERDRIYENTKEELNNVPRMSQFIVDYLAEDSDFIYKLIEMVKGEW